MSRTARIRLWLAVLGAGLMCGILLLPYGAWRLLYWILEDEEG